MSNSNDPFPQRTFGPITPLSDSFMMLYYLPVGSLAGSQTTTSDTYYTIWKATNCPYAECAGLLNYKTKSKGRPLLFTYRTVGNGFQFTGNEIANYTNTNAEATGNPYYMRTNKVTNNQNANNGFESFTLEQSSSSCQSTFQVSQVNTGLPKNELYTGCWYRMSSNGSKILPPVFDIPSDINSSNALFPHSATGSLTCTSNAVLQTPWVLFMPYTTNFSVWNGGICTAGTTNQGMLMYNAWIINTRSNSTSTIPQASQFPYQHCIGKLGNNSTNCAYMGNSCNNGNGLYYAAKGDGCGRFFGACDDGMTCVLNNAASSGKGFFCTSSKSGGTGSDPNGNKNGNLGKNGGQDWVVWVIIGIAALIGVVLIMSFTMDHVLLKKRNAKHVMANAHDAGYHTHGRYAINH